MPRYFLLIAATISFATSSLSYAQDEAPRENAALSYWQAIALIPQNVGENSAAMRKAIKAHDSSNPVLIKLVASSSSALKLMHRGSRIRNCDWGIAYEEGIAALLPHLSKLRQLAMIVTLRAMQKFDAIDVEGGTADLIAVMKMGRHACEDKLMISILVGVSIQDMAIQNLSHHMPQFRKTYLDKLQKDISMVRSIPSMKKSIQFEKRLMVDWLGDVVRSSKLKELMKTSDFQSIFKKNQTLPQRLQLIDDFRIDYEVIDEFVTLHPTECQKKSTQFENELKKDPAKHALALLLLPSCSAARRAESAHQVRLAMLHAGVAVSLKDKSVLAEKQYHDPIEKQPFEIEEFDGGFVLTSDLLHGKKPVSLTFGKRK